MLTTANSQWDQRLRLLRQHAMSVSGSARHGSAQVVFESYPELGYNYRMTDIQAAIGREQLRRLPGVVARRRVLANRYREILARIPGVGLPYEPEWARSNWQSYCVRLPGDCDQRTVMQRMLDAGVSTRRGVMCSHREPAYRELTPRWTLTNSEQAQDQCILLPLYDQMTDADQVRVAATLRQACQS